MASQKSALGALLVGGLLCSPASALAQSGLLHVGSTSVAAVGGGGGGVTPLTAPSTIVSYSNATAATSFSVTPTTSVASGQSVVVFVFSGSVQAIPSGCTATAACIVHAGGGTDNLSCDSDTATSVGTVYKCQGVLTADLKGSDISGTDQLKVGFLVATGPAFYAVGIPSGSVGGGATVGFSSNNFPNTGNVTLTPTRWAVAFEQDASNGVAFVNESSGYTTLGVSPMLSNL